MVISTFNKPLASVFTSGAVRENDPLPYASTITEGRFTDRDNALYFTGRTPELFTYAPRPEFRTDRQERPNRVLKNFRALYGRRQGEELRQAAQEALSLLQAEASSEELTFARRVLTKLARA